MCGIGLVVERRSSSPQEEERREGGGGEVDDVPFLLLGRGKELEARLRDRGPDVSSKCSFRISIEQKSGMQQNFTCTFLGRCILYFMIRKLESYH